MFRLDERVTLVTGGGQGVGAEIARTLAAAGAAVAVNDVDAERAHGVADEIASAGGRAMAAPADVTDPTALAAALDAVRGTFGPVSILINNAGIPATGMSMTTFADSAPSSWSPLIGLNVYGVLHCTHAVLPDMLTAGWGRVVTISSDSARVGDARIATYAAAKAFGPALMRSVAKEVGPHGVTCNSLSLGTVLPAGTDRPAEDVARQARHYATRRLGTPQDVAAAVLWLASDQGGWVTGQTIPVNGGYAAS